MKSEIIVEGTEAEEGGYCASALGYGINTQADSLENLRKMVRDAVDCYFDDPAQAPGIIRLQNNSPAPRIGFQPIDLSAFGQRN